MHITDAGLMHLAGLPLTNLDLNYCHDITDAGLAVLKDMKIRCLSLKHCRIFGSGFEFLQGQPIEELNLGEDPIEENCLKYLLRLPLKRLNLTDCGNISTKSIDTIRDKFPQIQIALSTEQWCIIKRNHQDQEK